MIDGRLLVPTGAAWAAAAGSLVLAGTVADLDQRHGWAVRGLVVVVTLAALLLGLLAEGWRRGRAGDRRVALTAVAVGGALLGSTVACLHVIALTPEGLTAWTRARVTAVVQGVVVTEPVIRSHPGAAVWQRTSRKEIRLATSAIAARGEILAVDVPMLVRVPDDAEVPPPGSVVEVTGRLSPAPAAAQVSATLTTDASQAHLVVVGDPGWIDRWTHAMRSGLREALEGTPPRAGALVAGLAVGDESLQPGDLAEQMRASGLSHLTAVSGGNVSIVVVLVVGIATALGVGLVIRVGAALMALAFFVVLVGPQPSVVRAAAMGGLVLLGLLAGGRRAGPSVLAASVLLLIVLAPGLAASWGLALSAFATGGLVLLAPRVQHWLDTSTITRRWPPAVREALAVTISAQVATLPILVAMGATVGWVSLPANLLAMPVVAPITVLGLLSSLFAPVSLPVAAVLSQAASWPAGWIARVAEVASGLPLASLPWPTGVWGVLLLAGAGLLVVVARAVGRRAYPEGTPTVVGRVAAALTACLVALWVLAPPDRRGWPPEGWFLLMCDVGQGDAILVRSGPQSAIVVDAGPDPMRVDRCLDDAGITSVPAVVLTHFHADHVDGLTGIFRGRDVAAVFVTPIRDPPEEAVAVEGWLRTEGRAATVLTAGDRRSIDGVTWRVLWPRRLISAGSVPNNASLVLVVETAGHRILLTGDIEAEAQAAISADLLPLTFDVVKIPHHGSRYQHPLLTTWARAPVALISVGEGNTYGHPASETIADWARHGAIVGRTDVQGDIAVVEVEGGVGVAARRGPGS